MFCGVVHGTWSDYLLISSGLTAFAEKTITTARNSIHHGRVISKPLGSSMCSKVASWFRCGEPLLHAWVLQGFANRPRLNALVEEELFVFWRQYFAVLSGIDFRK